MKIEFRNSTEEEKDRIYQIEDEYPDEIVVREIVVGFDGQTAIQILGITADMLAVGTVLFDSVRFIMEQRKERQSEKIHLTITFDDGTSMEINSVEEYEKVIHDPRVNEKSH